MSVRLDPSVRKLLDHYCVFAESSRPHVVQQALLLAFRLDAEFQRWLRTAPAEDELLEKDMEPSVLPTA